MSTDQSNDQDHNDGLPKDPAESAAKYGPRAHFLAAMNPSPRPLSADGDEGDQ